MSLSVCVRVYARPSLSPYTSLSTHDFSAFTKSGILSSHFPDSLVQDPRGPAPFLRIRAEYRDNIPTITKNLVLVRQIVDQGMQVRFMHLGCFIEPEGKVIVQGHREGRMFILNTNEVRTTMFANGQKVEIDNDLWHKRFSHVNFLRLREMHTKNIIFGLPKFSGQNGQVCEACQLGKQHRLAFPNDGNRSRNWYDVIHSDVWGPA